MPFAMRIGAKIARHKKKKAKERRGKEKENPSLDSETGRFERHMSFISRSSKKTKDRNFVARVHISHQRLSEVALQLAVEAKDFGCRQCSKNTQGYRYGI